MWGSEALFCWAPAAAAAKSLQSCPTLCDPTDGSPPGSPIPGILQARTLEWAAISFSNEWKWKVKGKSLSRVQLLATPWTAAYQAPPSMGFSRQEYWSGVPLPSPVRNTMKVKILRGKNNACSKIPRVYMSCVQSRFTHVWLCNPMNCSLPGSSVHRILQARIQEGVAISFSEIDVRLC